MVYSKGKAKKGKIMKTYDMRFDAETMAMLQNLKGSVLKSIRSDAEALPSSAYGIAEIITSRGAYALTSTIEVADYFGALEDVAMFRLAGLSIAMENAQDSVRRHAALVAPSNDNDGAVWAIEQILSTQ